jgi:hypothetical protein
MKRTRLRSRSSGIVLEGVNARCYTALMNLRAAERQADDDLQADIKRKAAELMASAELKVANECTTGARRKANAVKYRAAAREEASNYKHDREYQAMKIHGGRCEISMIAAERKIDELLTEAVDEQGGQKGNLGTYLWALRAGLHQRFNKIGVGVV